MMKSALAPMPAPIPQGPPSFPEAKNRRQRARACGMHPDYWYVVAHSHEVPREGVKEVVFWKRSIAVCRGADGRLFALENRCVHRQLKLSQGKVRGDELIGPSSAVRYNRAGQVVGPPGGPQGHQLPSLGVESFPVKERYGLIWLFPGDRARAESRALPDIPQIQGPGAWAYEPFDFTWRAHHSMIIDNVSDFTHAYLHRRYRPFTDAKLTHVAAAGDQVVVEYDTLVGGGPVYSWFVERKGARTDHIVLHYDYPYQRSNTGGRIFHWCFVLPMDERTTRVFFLFYYDVFKLPLPRGLMSLVHKLGNKLVIRPLLSEDGFALEAEQEGYDRHSRAPVAELNPAVGMFQDLTIRKWQEHLAQEQARALGHEVP